MTGTAGHAAGLWGRPALGAPRSDGCRMSLLALLQTGCLAAFAILLIAAGWQDLRTLRIANRLSLSTVAAFAVWATAGVALGRLSAAARGMTILCSFAVFALGATGFVAGLLGGRARQLLGPAT